MMELLVVISVIAILSIVGIGSFIPQLHKAWDSARKKDLNKLKVAFEEYYSDNGCYPTASLLANCNSNDLNPYLSTIPCDPQAKTPYPIDASPANCPQKYFLYTDLSVPADPQIVCNNKYFVTSPGISSGEITTECNNL